MLCSFGHARRRRAHRADRERYEQLYGAAIDAVGKGRPAPAPDAAPAFRSSFGAVPRFDARQQGRIDSELYPRLLRLAAKAAAADIG